MPPVRRGKPAIRSSILGPASLSPEPAPTPTPVPNNNLFQEFMRTCIKRVRDQAPAALAAPAAEAKDDSDKLLKP